MPRIQPDQILHNQLASRGVTEKTGVFGEHKVQLGKGEPIRLDSIKANKVPFQGFTAATKVVRGKEGLTKTANDTLQVLKEPGTLNAKSLLGCLKTAQDFMTRLDKLGQLSPQQKESTLWAFAPAVENLSNAELTAVYHASTSGDMDLLQSALMREGQINAKAGDARSAASLLFDLQALVLKEVSNRSVRGMVDDLAAAHPEDASLTALRMPPRLSEEYGAQGAAMAPAQPHDISPANLRTLVETAAESATTREKTAAKEAEALRRRDLPSVSVKEMADVLRSAELTINVDVDVLLSESGIMAHPDEPMKNIFHLAEEETLIKGEGYLARRDAAERLLFPELEGHAVQADERPVYGALNVQGRRIGAVSAGAGYGSAAIVLKDDVARRATYIAEDTFYAPVVNMSQERRTSFYALLDGAGLPEEFTTACRDVNSKEHKALENWFDSIAKVPDARASAFIALPSDINLTDMDQAARFKGLLLDCFGDRAATRSLLATHDNLEALIPHMSNFDGNALAMAAMKNADGSHPRVHLTGAQYIEAQIQGPLIPSRDIAEIRINIDDVPEENLEALRIRMAAFEERTGIHVNLIENFDLGREVEGINRLHQEEQTFQLSHLDRERIDAEVEAVLTDLPGHIAQFIEAEQIGGNLAPGTLRLEGNALGSLAEKFVQTVKADMKNRGLASLEPESLVRHAFQKMAKPMLQQKAKLLAELEHLPFATEAQKDAFAYWICSARVLRSPEELRIIHTHATAQAEMLRELINADTAPSPDDVFRRTGALMQRASDDLNAFITSLGDADFGADDKAAELDRISFMSLAMLENGTPAVDKQAMQRLQTRLNAPEQLQLMGQLLQIGQRSGDEALADSEDFGVMNATVLLMQRNAFNTARVTNVEFKNVPTFTAELSLIPQSAREALHEVAPQTAAALDRTHPGYPAFPTAAMPAAMPANGTERREFLLANLDTYMNHERTFERGTSVHGRGHIARAFIFASTMCSILEEQGVPMDRNAVLCGITGHDLGRQGGGTDRWEDRSANMTVDAMKAAFGATAMGADYEQAVKDSIDAHRGQTLEAMLLNAADSLDIGRTQEFNPERFAFLHGKAGEKPTRNAEAIRRELALEADRLQRLTNPLCQSRNVLDKLVQTAATAPAPLAERCMQDRQELLDAIREEFAREWNKDADSFMRGIEKVIADHADLFPLLSKYYRP